MATARVSLPPASRIGVFGGTFDPIHLGHLIAAEHAREVLGLALVWFVPAQISPLKPAGGAAEAGHRVAMIERAIAGQPAFAVNQVDLERDGPSYTVDTLTRLRAEVDGWAAGDAVDRLTRLRAEVDGWAAGDPGGDDSGAGHELVFVLGADAARDLPRWRDPAGIARQARLVVLSRPGYERNLAALVAELPALDGRIDVLPERQVAISATEIRQRVREGRSIRYLVPDMVRAYIGAHGLYRGDGAP